jgi:hypothetical protein
MRHADTFGAAWSIAPDPLDFRAFQRTDIYADHSMFGDANNPTPSIVSRSGATLLTVRDEYRMEKVLGPGTTSAQQWDSWQAVFGPRDAAGRIVPLFDPNTGVIDPKVADAWRSYDIAHLVREQPERYAALLRERAHIFAAADDQFGLETGTALLFDALTPGSFAARPDIGGPAHVRQPRHPGHAQPSDQDRVGLPARGLVVRDPHQPDATQRRNTGARAHLHRRPPA